MLRILSALMVVFILLTVTPQVAKAFAIRDTYHKMIENYVEDIRDKPENQGLSESELWQKAEIYVVEVQKNRGYTRYEAIGKPLLKGADIWGGDSYDDSVQSRNATIALINQSLSEVQVQAVQTGPYAPYIIGAAKVVGGLLSGAKIVMNQREKNFDSHVMYIAKRSGISLTSDNANALDAKVRAMKELARSDQKIPGSDITWDQYFNGTIWLTWPNGIQAITLYSHTEEVARTLKRYDNGKRTQNRLDQIMLAKTQVSLEDAKNLIGFRDYVEGQFKATIDAFESKYGK